jgi:hypothetical protein
MFPMWGTVGSISERKRADGTIAYKAEIVVRKDGVRHKLSQTFDREAAARHWIKRREEELRKPGGLSKLERTRTVTRHTQSNDTLLSLRRSEGRRPKFCRHFSCMR